MEHIVYAHILYHCDPIVLDFVRQYAEMLHCLLSFDIVLHLFSLDGCLRPSAILFNTPPPPQKKKKKKKKQDNLSTNY